LLLEEKIKGLCIVFAINVIICAGAGFSYGEQYWAKAYGGSLDVGITDLLFNNVIDDLKRIALIPPNPFAIGWSVTSGDFNGDGLSDAVASGHHYGVCLYYGNNEIPTTPDQILTDPSDEGGFGFFVTSVGDVNNDGFDELIVTKDRGT